MKKLMGRADIENYESGKKSIIDIPGLIESLKAAAETIEDLRGKVNILSSALASISHDPSCNLPVFGECTCPKQRLEELKGRSVHILDMIQPPVPGETVVTNCAKEVIFIEPAVNPPIESICRECMDVHEKIGPGEFSVLVNE